MFPNELQHAIVAALAGAGAAGAALPVCRAWRAWAHEHLRRGSWPKRLADNFFALFQSVRLGVDGEGDYLQFGPDDADRFSFGVTMWGEMTDAPVLTDYGIYHLAFMGRLAQLQAGIERLGEFPDMGWGVARAAGLGGQLGVLKWLIGQADERSGPYSRTVRTLALRVEAFRGASQGGRLDCVRWLCAGHAEEIVEFSRVNGHDSWALRFACRGGHLATAKYIAEAFELGPVALRDALSALGSEAFVAACAGGHLETAQWVYAQGMTREAAMEAGGGHGFAALFAACSGLAARSGHEHQTRGTVEWLLDLSGFREWRNFADLYVVYALLNPTHRHHTLIPALGPKSHDLVRALRQIDAFVRGSTDECQDFEIENPTILQIMLSDGPTEGFEYADEDEIDYGAA